MFDLHDMEQLHVAKNDTFHDPCWSGVTVQTQTQINTFNYQSLK